MIIVPDKVERPSKTIEDVDTTVWSSFEAGVEGARDIYKQNKSKKTVAGNFFYINKQNILQKKVVPGAFFA